MAAQTNRPLHAAIMTHQYDKDKRKVNNLLTHFRANRDEDDNWIVEDADLTQGAGPLESQVMFTGDDILFMEKYYKTDEGKELIRLFLENEERFPSASDIETVEGIIREIAERKDVKNSETVRINSRLAELTAEKTRLDRELTAEKTRLNQELLAAQTSTTNMKNEISKLRELVAGGGSTVSLEGASMATRFQNFLNNSTLY
tara:strand:- start:6894 stop:7499 length:606 start_codon:yes stop_codon:yes gene_type:complete